ncbi:MAG: hypothetical protein DWI22_09900 [Planctomycetota bacterium]|nr:MAG: hypothetical protein DWI22_09900 [Planctomycetota bacterium]
MRIAVAIRENADHRQRKRNFLGFIEKTGNICRPRVNPAIIVATGGMSAWLAVSCRTAESYGVFDNGLFI